MFAPSEEEKTVFESPERFLVPRRGELTAALRQGLEDHRAGTLSAEEMAERLRRAGVNVPEVFAGLAEQLNAPDEYAQSVLLSLNDCQALFEAGLSDILQGVTARDDFPIRFGWLLLEKGEEEYLSILGRLQHDAAGGALAIRPDALSQLVAARERGDLDAAGLATALDSLEQELSQSLEESRLEIREGLARARSYDGLDATPVEQARGSLRRAAERLARALLSVS